MHQFFVALATLLFSLCHHPLAGHSMVYQASAHSSAITFPDRRDLARQSNGGGYAETGCASCLRTNTSYITR